MFARRATVDARIDQSLIDVQFRPCLSQSSCDTRTCNLVQLASVLPVLRSVISSMKRTLVFDTKASSDEDNDKSIDKDNGTTGNYSGRTIVRVITPVRSMLSILTPRMSCIVEEQSTKSVITNYLGN